MSAFSDYARSLALAVIRRGFIDRDGAQEHPTVLLSGMGRSGTTWCTTLLNPDGVRRVMNEPFAPPQEAQVPRPSPFTAYQYLRPGSIDHELKPHAHAILSGGVSNRWTNLDVRRLVKDVRTNLLLGWLRSHFPSLPIVLLVRHPFAVVRSWRRLGWGTHHRLGHPASQMIVQQEQLMSDYPLLAKVAADITPEDDHAQLMFLWGALHYVPLQQFEPGDLIWASYEDLLLNPQQSIPRLYASLGFTYHKDRIEPQPLFSRPTGTNFNHTDFDTNREDIAFGWRDQVDAADRGKGQEILTALGLDRLYDEEDMFCRPPLMATVAESSRRGCESTFFSYSTGYARSQEQRDKGI